MSGSGKSVALHSLEDLGFYCVDNLPPELLIPFVDLDQKLQTDKIAIAMDVRSRLSLPQVPAQLSELRKRDINIRLLFLESTTDTLVHRYSETRRRHPLSQQSQQSQKIDPTPGTPGYNAALNEPQEPKNDSKKSSLQDNLGIRNLIESIELERDLLADLREMSHIIDTSLLRRSKLQSYILSLIGAPAAALTLMFESFAFKRGIPVHADYVFDVRMLPNPYYDPSLRDQTGLDEPVANWLEQHKSVISMEEQIAQFVNNWLPSLDEDHRSYVTVAIGCTGGQHRSVFLVEKLAKVFSSNWLTLKRHRELDN
jgi:UPF0042 nucleotide-binding protein